MPIAIEAIRQALTGRYEVDRPLGRGSMSLVFAGRAADTGAEVAIKVLRPEFAATIVADRFRQEIAILRGLDHPNILRLIDSGLADELVYFAMPFAHGGSLRTRLQQERRLSVPAALGVAREIASALDYAHARRIVHRDLKPENVLFEEGRAMLCDFGVARAVLAAGRQRISTSGFVVGTPAYISPEQGAGEPIDHRSDVYALACVLYEMLAGEPPFTGPTPQAVIARHLGERPPSLRTLRPDAPAALEAAVLRGLAKDRHKRPDKATELVSDASRP